VLGAGATATTGDGTTIALVMAVVWGAIGLAVLLDRRPRILLSAQTSLSLLYWILGQGLGGVFTGEATDVGTAPLMILIALVLYRAIPAPRPSRNGSMNHAGGTVLPRQLDTRRAGGGECGVHPVLARSTPHSS
jgi:hypothetical protein